jgi:hypothetical protein
MGQMIRRTSILALAAGLFACVADFAAASPFAVKDCNATFKACVASCGKTKKCTAQCGEPWETCFNNAMAAKPPPGLRKKPPR